MSEKEDLIRSVCRLKDSVLNSNNIEDNPCILEKLNGVRGKMCNYVMFSNENEKITHEDIEDVDAFIEMVKNILGGHNEETDELDCLRLIADYIRIKLDE